MSNAFRTAVERRDPDAMAAALHPDVVFHSPAVFKPYEGREATMRLMRHALEVFEDFRYLDELSSDGSHGLVFAARVGDKTLEGWDYLKLDGDGLITELTVMVRPLSGLIALAQAMGERFAADAAAPQAADAAAPQSADAPAPQAADAAA
jgi:SnoaL-like domain